MKFLTALLFLTITATISMSAVAAPSERSDLCSYDLTDLLDKKEFAAGDKKTYTANSIRFLSAERIAQLRMFQRDLETGSLKELFANVDDGKIYKFTFVSSHLPADYYTVIYAYAGDNSVGLIFNDDTAHVAAHIGDDDIGNCR